jgi:hypothetical protein
MLHTCYIPFPSHLYFITLKNLKKANYNAPHFVIFSSLCCFSLSGFSDIPKQSNVQCVCFCVCMCVILCMFRYDAGRKTALIGVIVSISQI